MINNIMKSTNLLTITALALSLLTASCDKNQPMETDEDTVNVSFVYTLSVDNGEYMRTKASNAEVLDKFYKKIISGELVAPSYELVFTEKSTGTKYEISGNWDDRDMVTLRKGSYSVTGKSTAAGDNIQDKCSLTISDEIVVDGSENVISLSAAYDCSLIIFTDTSVSSLSNYNGEETNDLFKFDNYIYAFVSTSLFKNSFASTAYLIGKRTDNSTFKIFTGTLTYEKGKYYVYNNIKTSFRVDEMEDGGGGEKGEITKRTFTVNGVSFNMILVEAGSYNGPSGLVTITRDYWIGETMVTQGLYEAVMGYNPSYHKGSDLFPVEQVSRRDFESFLLSLNTSLKSLFRLPYEVEWDYACMGGKYSKGYKYPGSDNADEVAWTKENSAVNGVLQSHEVATKLPNELGLYDMCGNLWEWCHEDYVSTYPSGTDPFRQYSGIYTGLTKSDTWEYEVKDWAMFTSRWYFFNGNKLGGFRLAL